MALLGANKIRSSALADLNNSISHIETFTDCTSAYQTLVSDASCNINFAERIGVISSIEAREYRERLYKARDNIERRQSTDRISEQVKIDRHRSFMEHREKEMNRKAESIQKDTTQITRTVDYERERSKY